MKKTIKINPNSNCEKELHNRYAQALGTVTGTIHGVLKYAEVDETAKRVLLRALREVERGDSVYSQQRIEAIEALAGNLGFEFES